MTFLTCCRVLSETALLLFKTLDTVAMETPACFATSYIVEEIITTPFNIILLNNLKVVIIEIYVSGYKITNATLIKRYDIILLIS